MNTIHLIILFFFFTSLFTKSTSSKNSKYDICSAKFDCGDKKDLGYPFYGSTRPRYCGHPGFKLDCYPDNPLNITISDQEYNVRNVQDVDKYTITVSRNDTWQGGCPDRLTNTTMDFSKFNPSSTNQNITFFCDCQGSNAENLSSQVVNATCDLGYGPLHGFYLTQKMVDEYKSLNLFKKCNYSIFIPVSESGGKAVDGDPDNLDVLMMAFDEGFDLGLITNISECSSCMDSNGVCGFDFDKNKFVCHCDDQDYNLQFGVNSPTDQDTDKAVYYASYIVIC